MNYSFLNFKRDLKIPRQLVSLAAEKRGLMIDDFWGRLFAKTSAEKKQLGERKMKKRKSDASHEKREEEEGEEEEEEELRLPPLPSTRLSKEALIDKFKNFEDMKVRPPSSSRDDDDIERGELKMDFNKVPEILKDFDRGGKTAATPTMDSLDFLPTRMMKMKSWRRNRKERKKKKKKMVMMMMIKILVSRRNYYPTRRMIVRVNCEMWADIALNEGEYAGKARAERRCSRTRKRN